MTRAFLARHGPEDAPALAPAHGERLTEAAGGPVAAGAKPAAAAPASQPDAAPTAEPGVGAAAPSGASPAPAAPQHGAAVPRPSAGIAAAGAAAQGAERGSTRPSLPTCREAAVEDGVGLAAAPMDCPLEQPAADVARGSGGAEPGQAALRPEPDQAPRSRGGAGKRRRTLAARAVTQGAPAEPDQAPGAGAGQALPPREAGRAPEGIAEAGGGPENQPPPTPPPPPRPRPRQSSAAPAAPSPRWPSAPAAWLGGYAECHACKKRCARRARFSGMPPSHRIRPGRTAWSACQGLCVADGMFLRLLRLADQGRLITCLYPLHPQDSSRTATRMVQRNASGPSQSVHFRGVHLGHKLWAARAGRASGGCWRRRR